MTETNPQEHEQILHQLHADVLLERLKDYLDPDCKSKLHEKDASDLKDIVRRLLAEDASPSLDSEDIQKVLVDCEIQNQLKQSIRHLINSQSKDEP